MIWKKIDLSLLSRIKNGKPNYPKKSIGFSEKKALSPRSVANTIFISKMEHTIALAAKANCSNQGLNMTVVVGGLPSTEQPKKEPLLNDWTGLSEWLEPKCYVVIAEAI